MVVSKASIRNQSGCMNRRPGVLMRLWRWEGGGGRGGSGSGGSDDDDDDNINNNNNDNNLPSLLCATIQLTTADVCGLEYRSALGSAGSSAVMFLALYPI